jgi:AcrR family transcriptional regulator
MSATPTKLWRGQTLDDRSLVRRRQLLQAGFELLGTDGVNGVTMRAVCRRAGLSLRYFYESFSGTDELTVAVYDQCNAELTSAIAGSADLHPDRAEGVAAAVDAAASYFEQDRRRVRILLREPLSSEILGRRRAAFVPAMLAWLNTSRGVTRADRTEFAMTASGLSGALVALVLDWTDGRLEVTRSQLVDHATRLVLTNLPARGQR